MIPLNNEPQMDKNYWLALGLMMAIVLFYPSFMKWLSPPKATQTVKTDLPQEKKLTVTSPNQLSYLKEPISAPEGPFLGKAEKPAVINYESKFYEIQFSTMGASIIRLWYKDENGKNKRMPTLFYETDATQSGIFGLKLWRDEADLSEAIFKLSQWDKQNEQFEFTYEKPGDYRVTKQYLLENAHPVIKMKVIIENLSSREKHFPVELIYGIHYELNQQTTPQSIENVVLTDKLETADLSKITKKGFSITKDIEWAAAVKKYFAVIVKPDWKSVANSAKANEKSLIASLQMEPVSVKGAESASRQFLIYAGPQRYETLKSFNLGFENILTLNPGFMGIFKGMVGLFKIWLLIALKFFNQYTHNYGWAIILLTLVLKGLFTPLTHMSFENMKKMQVLQPKMKSLQERYKKDPTKLNREMMELYRRNRVNPMAGCLPMLVQIPIFVGFYFMLSDTIELKGAPFILWVHDLSEPDRLLTLPFSIPFLGDAFNVLPLLMIGSMVWQQKLTPQAGVTPEQAKIFALMPLFMGFIFYGMPSGLVLYWFFNNILSIIHQIFVKRMVVVLHHEDRE